MIYDEDEEDEEKNLTYLEMLDNVGTEDLDEEEYDESDYNEELNDSLYDSNFC